MSSPELSFSTQVQDTVISGNLNSSMLLNFLMGKSIYYVLPGHTTTMCLRLAGVYTMVYSGTAFLYGKSIPLSWLRKE